MSGVLSYEGIDEAVLVHALYHGTRPLGTGILHDAPNLTIEQVRADLAKFARRDGYYFDYYRGRPLKMSVDTKAKTITTALYDRDAGHGMAAGIVAGLRAANPGVAP